MVSIVVLSYKNGNYLFETLDSIFKQDYPAIEIIVANDGEKGFDEETVRNYIEKKKKNNVVNYLVYRNSENLGTVRNMNNALSLCNGDYIKFIAGDDAFPTNSVFSKQTKALDEVDALVCVGNVIECDIKMKTLAVNGFYELKSFFNSKRNYKRIARIVLTKKNSLMATQAICFKKGFFKKYGEFDDRFVLIEDLPLETKIMCYPIDFVYINYPVVSHRIDSGISSAKGSFFDENKLLYYRDLKNYFELVLSKYKTIVGKRFFKHRFNISKFRIEYIETGHSKKLFFKYFFSLLYYFLHNYRRVKKGFSK